MTDFSSLLPDTLFQALESQGFMPTGVFYPLNSYENRVYEIQVEEGNPIIAKFYRPGRWDLKALKDEHQFMEILAEAEIPVVTPLTLQHPVEKGFPTLGSGDGFYYTFYPKFRGRERPELQPEDRRWLGRTLGRLHNIGESFKASHRLVMNPETFGYPSLEFILQRPWLPEDLKQNLESLLLQALKLVEIFFKTPFPTIALHGDLHPGNILWNHDGPHLVDFDDMVRAPAVQDVWMLFYGDAEEKRIQKESFFEGYSVFRRFDESSLILAEPLRTLRIIHHAAWIGKRYEEPAFQRAFPYYEQRRYWEEFLLSIKEQISLLQEVL